MAAIARLSPNERQVITLYYYEELMLKDIAQLMQVTPARVSQIHSRALLKIRTELEGYLQQGD
jgi:RNA polymerase sigma factor for flagellar operon FliA